MKMIFWKAEFCPWSAIVLPQKKRGRITTPYRTTEVNRSVAVLSNHTPINLLATTLEISCSQQLITNVKALFRRTMTFLTIRRFIMGSDFINTNVFSVTEVIATAVPTFRKKISSFFKLKLKSVFLMPINWLNRNSQVCFFDKASQPFSKPITILSTWLH